MSIAITRETGKPMIYYDCSEFDGSRSWVLEWKEGDKTYTEPLFESDPLAADKAKEEASEYINEEEIWIVKPE